MKVVREEGKRSVSVGVNTCAGEAGGALDERKLKLMEIKIIRMSVLKKR